MTQSRLTYLVRSRRGRLVVTAITGVFGLLFALVAARHFAESPWPFSRGHPALLVAAGGISLLGYALKAFGWSQLFAANERPRPLSLLAANGGAAVTALALPGRFDDVVRIAIIRRFRGTGSPAGVRSVCLSLFMLGLIDAAALAPLALAAAVLPGHSLGVRLGLVLIAVVGFACGAVIFVMPRIAGSQRALRFRIGRWVSPRTTPLREASLAWVMVSANWLTRAVGLVVLLGALGVGFSFTLALLFLCATSAAAALPVGPGGTATQAGAGAAVLIASGIGVTEAVGATLAIHAVGILVGGLIFVSATAWRAGLQLRLRHQPVRPVAIS